LKATALRLVALFGIVSALILGGASGAAAHETRKVGPYEFTVGWGDEPTYTTYKNSVQLLIADAKSGEPFNNLEDTLDVEVTFGDQSTTMPVEPDFLPGVFGEEGDYRAWLTPTRAGEYTFHFTGTVGNTEVDEEFTSGPDTFATPVDVKEVEFPVKDPTTGELAQRLTQELPRAEEAAADEADSAKTIAIVGVIVGIVGLIVAIVALVGARRKA
jgi:hypothetical protein